MMQMREFSGTYQTENNDGRIRESSYVTIGKENYDNSLNTRKTKYNITPTMR